MISTLTHPDFDSMSEEWLKWRLTYEGGKQFINTYLQRLSLRETDSDYAERLAVTYCPALAKLGIKEIRDSIYNRLFDVTREGGSATYDTSVEGQDGGVDMLGSSMNYFMGCKVLPELLTMRKVGIYIDMPPLRGSSISANQKIRPYLYMFNAEDIRNWVYDDGHNYDEFSNILLQERVPVLDEVTGFPTDFETRYRHLWLDSNRQVQVAFYKPSLTKDVHGRSIGEDMVDQYGNIITEPISLGITKIPFVVLDIGESLLTDVANYQIALMNLASTDMIYALKSNFPFYTEQFDPRIANNATRPDGKAVEEVTVGTGQGRRYPPGMDRPDFIHPSSEPITASMAKQEQIKQELRLLLKLSITNLKPAVMASAQSKDKDNRSLENGLSFIGMVLEHAERAIAKIWQMYEGNGQIATINYPKDYNLNSEEDRRGEATYLEDVKKHVNSETFQRVVQKRLAQISLGSKVSSQVLEKIESEIDSSPSLVNDPDVILKSVENGLCGLDLGSELLGFPEGEADNAKEDHAERLARIAAAQTESVRGLPKPRTLSETEAEKLAARGVPDLAADPKQAAAERAASIDKTQSDTVKTKVRGKGR